MGIFSDPENNVPVMNFSTSLSSCYVAGNELSSSYIVSFLYFTVLCFVAAVIVESSVESGFHHTA